MTLLRRRQSTSCLTEFRPHLRTSTSPPPVSTRPGSPSHFGGTGDQSKCEEDHGRFSQGTGLYGPRTRTLVILDVLQVLDILQVLYLTGPSGVEGRGTTFFSHTHTTEGRPFRIKRHQ